MRDQDTASGITRRKFGQLAGAAGLAAAASPAMLRAALAATADSSEIIAGKASGLIIHNAKLAVMETPLPMLREHAHTPKEILYNRFHFPHEGNAAWYASTAPAPADMVKNWTIRVDGLVQRPRTLTIADLEKRPQEKRVMVLQCAGNGRSYYAAKQKVAGGQWKNGGMGCVEWEGVALKPLLDDLKMVVSPEAHWLTAGGWDQPGTPEGSDFAKSYHLDDPALEHAILALKMNGEAIPAQNGGPVRLVIPGFYGNMHVKMLTESVVRRRPVQQRLPVDGLSHAAGSGGAGPVRGQRLHHLQLGADLRPEDQERDLLAAARR